MSRDRSYRITCDGPGPGDDGWCDNGSDTYAEAIEMCETRVEAERIARLEGWSIGKHDRCPTCRNGPNREPEQ